MSRLSEQEINDIRAKASIVEVISHYLPLSRKGRNYTAVCPFHDDHDPSMSISEDKQIFKCFVCGTGGNVFTFVSKYEQISFIEAVYKVAEIVGIPMEKTLELPSRSIDPHIAKLYKACADTIEYTHYQLHTPDAQKVKNYLAQRSIDDTLIDHFELGYNPNQDALYRFLNAKKHTDESLLEAGVVRMSSQGIADVFANRLMIPIHDENGNPVGFSARRLSDSEEAKYINTQETKIYHKGELIYNYHRAKSEARKAKCVYLVEGAMDVISLAKVGIYHALATLGTACTNEQIRLLAKLGVDVIVCYDGDTAGKNATFKFGKAAKGKLSFTIVDNKTGLDPDEIIDAYGKEELEKTLHKTISWVGFLFDYLLTKYDLNNYSQKKSYAMELAEEISQLKDDFEQANYYVRLRELTGFDMSVQKQEQVKPKKQPEYQKRTYLTYPKSGVMAAAYEILSQMLHARSASNYFKDKLGFLKDDDSNTLAMYMINHYRNHKTIAVADLLNEIKEASVRDLLLSVADWELACDEVNMNAMNEAFIKMKTCILDDKIASLIQEAAAVNDPIQKAKIADRRNALIRERNELFLEREEQDHEAGKKQ